jgi:DNA (cytosine-5)-methyltransferase 1
MNELALFAGAGGGILGGKLLGWRTVCAVEYDAYAASVLVARQNDGCLEPFPVWSDVRTFDGRPWRGIAEVVSGGFPCTDISAAGKGAGITGKQSGLWTEMARIVGEVRPRFVFVENSPLLVKRGLAVVLGDLAEMGYDARWGIVGAHHVGAPHKRHRAWIVGDSNDEGLEGLRHTHGAAVEAQPFSSNSGTAAWREDWRSAATKFCRVDDGMAHRVDRLKAIGNGQVPAVAALAWRLLGGPTA